jgi:hypothetical protein
VRRPRSVILVPVLVIPIELTAIVLVTAMVLVAGLGPVLGMSRWNIQVDRLDRYRRRRERLRDRRLRVHRRRRWPIAEHQLPGRGAHDTPAGLKAS